MTRLILPAAVILLAGLPVWAQDNATPKPAPAAMKCGMMAEMKMGAMKDGPASDLAAKLTAKKKELKLNDKQIQQIAAALAPSEPHDMSGMKMDQMKCCDHTAETPASHAEHQP